MNVYDFDNTIYDGESCLDFFLFYIRKTPRLLRYLPRVLYAFARYKMGKVTVEQALERYAPLVEDYFAGIEDFDADCRAFWDMHMHKIKPFYEQLRREDDVIVSASPELSLREICARLGINAYVGSVLDPESGKITRLCMRSRKLPAFLEAYPNAEIENFYTDSVKNDKAMVDMAKNAYQIRGNKIIKIK